MPIRILQNSNRKICLSFGGWTAIIDLINGANCISLRNNLYRVRILREPENPELLDNPYLYGMPILFPVNRIENGVFTFEGKTYRFPINEPATSCHLHGFLHETPFEVILQSKSRAVCQYQTDGVKNAVFPQACTIELDYSLSNNGLTLTTGITNDSDLPLPCMLGFHTTFNLCFSDSSDPSYVFAKVDLAEEYERAMGTTYLPTGRIPPFDEVSKALVNGTWKPADRLISRHYLAENPREMRLTDAERNLSIVYRNDAAFSHRLIYGGGETGFFCMEPQTCIANAPNAPFPEEKTKIPVIAPHETRRFRSFISMERIERL